MQQRLVQVINDTTTNRPYLEVWESQNMVAIRILKYDNDVAFTFDKHAVMQMIEALGKVTI